MEDVLWYVFRIWTNRPAQLLLYGGFLIHYGLALWALWQRRSLRLRTPELSQIILGFAIPILLARHVVNTRIADNFFHTDTGYYAFLLWVYFVRSPDSRLSADAGLGGRLGSRDDRLALLAPGQALVRAAAAVCAGPRRAGAGAVPARHDRSRPPGCGTRRRSGVDAHGVRGDDAAFADTQRILAAITDGLSWFFGGVVAAVLLARVIRRAWQRRRGLVRVGYPDGRFVEVTPGTSVLEASRIAAIPHASVCGGRGRCSTCRVRVRGEIHSIDPPSANELRVLNRIGARPNIRLACMLRPRGAVEVTPLLPPLALAADGRRRVDFVQGSEREIAILFADIRGFTALSEGRLPYDVVFILNRYFAAMGRAVEAAGGRVDKFVGDGVMALFGIEAARKRAAGKLWPQRG